MRTSILICATCLLVTGCSAQFRLPSLSSALSSLTGFGSSAGSSSGGGGGGGGGGGSNGAQSSQASSAYSGLVRDYGRNLMMAMSSIYPTLFKPPQQQQQAQQQQQQQQQQQMQQSVGSPFEQFGASQSVPSQSLFSGQSGPTFSFGGSTFSISPSFPFGSLGGASSQQQGAPSSNGGPQQQGSHSPFSASFGSSINSPPSFGPLSNSPFMSQSMPSFAPASSYSAAFEAANGGANSGLGGGPPQSANGVGSSSMGSPLFAAMSQGPSSFSANGLNSAGSMLSQAQQSNPINSYSPIQNYAGQHDSAAQLLSQPSHHQAQSVGPQSGPGQQHQSAASAFGIANSGPGPQLSQPSMGQQYQNSQQFRPDMMSVAASAPVPSSSSYSNYGSAPSQQGQAPSSSSYQQPSYR